MLLWVCTVMDQNMVGASMTHFAVPHLPRCCPYQTLRSPAKICNWADAGQHGIFLSVEGDMKSWYEVGVLKPNQKLIKILIIKNLNNS